MGDSDEEYDKRRSRDKFRRERDNDSHERMDFWIFLNYLKRFWSFLIFRFWFAVKSTKMKNKKTLDHVAKLELEKWFESRKLHPYASNTDIQVLALKTKVEENKIK